MLKVCVGLFNRSEIKIISQFPNILPVRCISSMMLKLPEDRPPPFPYWDREYNYFWKFVDFPTWHRFGENSKVIIVDGPIASGKTEVAKKLAEIFGMQHFEEPTTDLYYINEGGYDMRQLDPKLPYSCRSFDENNFLQDPRHPRCSLFQMLKFRLRFSVYHDALVHLFHTGQGVVSERSPYSDSAFVYAMRECGYIPDRVWGYYQEVARHMFPFYLRPHLIIYLDVPVDKVKENIKKRNRPFEVNSPALSTEFLQHMEDYYKITYLKQLGTHSKVLIYDWSEGGDAEIIAEDIERITDFDTHENPRDPVLADWNLEMWEYETIRWRLAYDKYEQMQTFYVVQRIDVPEILTTGEDCSVWHKVWLNAPGMKYSKGYDPAVDKNILFKVRNQGPYYNNSLD